MVWDEGLTAVLPLPPTSRRKHQAELSRGGGRESTDYCLPKQIDCGE